MIMSIAMVAMLAFGGTFAYFTATAGAAIEGGSVKTGTVALGLGETKTITSTYNATDTFAVPGDTLWDIALDIDTSGSNVAIYVFATWSLTNSGNVTLTGTEMPTGWSQLKDESEADVTGVYYRAVAATENSIDYTASIKFAESNGTTAMDQTISCSVSFCAAQQGNLSVLAAAKEAGAYSGTVTNNATNYPSVDHSGT